MVKLKNCIKKVIPSFLLKILKDIFINNLYTYKLKCYLRGFYIEYMVLVVGQACNYQCIDCANFCPISPKEYRRYSVDNIIDSIDILLKHVKYIDRLQIQGGEPFIYSELDKLLQYLCMRKEIHIVEIATNGSIIPSERVMKIIGENGVKIRISNYDISKDIVINLKSKCEKLHIKYSVYNFASGETTWFQCGGKNIGKQSDNVDVKFRTCLFNRCLTLERGELSHCSRATNSYHIQGFERNVNDYVKVEDSISFEKQLKSYLLQPVPMEACYYCYGTTTERIVAPAKQDNKSNL